MATTDIRTQGAFGYSGISYDTTAKQPLDARMLVPSYAALINPENWKITLPDGSIGTLAYNGMIVAVADKEDKTNNGIYMLLDYEAKKNPNTATYDNWHKLANLDELNSLSDRVKALEDNGITITEEQIQEIITAIGNEFVKNDDAYAALMKSVSNNEAAIKALIADDTDKSIRAIAQEEIAVQLDDNESDLGVLASRIGKNEEAIEALKQSGGVSPEDVYAILTNTSADALIEDSNEIKVDGRKLLINQVGVSKLYEDMKLILNGGSAVEKGE